ncbi:MAG: hypothetical protein QM500_03425 [Methylococcales bacterium]
MKKNSKKVFALIGISLFVGATGWYYYANKNSDMQHGVGVMDLSCSDNVVFSLRLKLDDDVQWTKTHNELLSMVEAEATLDRRFQGQRIMPLAALLKPYGNASAIEVTPCDGENISIGYSEVMSAPDLYFLGQNKRKRMKLLKYIGDRKYATLKRNVIDINLIE